MLLGYVFHTSNWTFLVLLLTDEVATSQLRKWITEEVLCQPKVGISVCEHETDHEEKKSEKGTKLEPCGTNQDKGVNGVEINKGSETVEVAQAWR